MIWWAITIGGCVISLLVGIAIGAFAVVAYVGATLETGPAYRSDR